MRRIHDRVGTRSCPDRIQNNAGSFQVSLIDHQFACTHTGTDCDHCIGASNQILCSQCSCHPHLGRSIQFDGGRIQGGITSHIDFITGTGLNPLSHIEFTICHGNGT